MFKPPDPGAVDDYETDQDTPIFGWHNQTYTLSHFPDQDGEYGLILYRWRVVGYLGVGFYRSKPPPTLQPHIKDIWALSRVYLTCPDYQDMPFWQFLNISMGGK